MKYIIVTAMFLVSGCDMILEDMKRQGQQERNARLGLPDTGKKYIAIVKYHDMWGSRFVISQETESREGCINVSREIAKTVRGEARCISQ